MSKTLSTVLLGTACAATVGFALPAAAQTALVNAEASVRGATSNQANYDETGLGRTYIKYDAGVQDASKSYYQFDLTGLNVDTAQGGTVTFTPSVTDRTDRDQAMQAWALDQEYASFDSEIEWSTAQANDVATNDLLSTGALTATAIGGVREIRANEGAFSIEFASLAPFVFNDSFTVVLTGAPTDTAGINDGAAMRISLGTTTLNFTEVPEPGSLALLGAGGLLLMKRKRHAAA